MKHRHFPTLDSLPYMQLRPAPTDPEIQLSSEIDYLRELLTAAVTQLAVVEKAVRRA